MGRVVNESFTLTGCYAA